MGFNGLLSMMRDIFMNRILQKGTEIELSMKLIKGSWFTYKTFI